MGNEFGEMFDRVQQERVDAARRAEQAAEDARSQSRRDFDTKAACLIDAAAVALNLPNVTDRALSKGRRSFAPKEAAPPHRAPIFSGS